MKLETAKVGPIAPRLLDVTGAAGYLSVGVQTIRDWTEEGILEPVKVPGAKLRKNGQTIAGPRKRSMVKLLFDRQDLDRLVDQLKRDAGRAPVKTEAADQN